MTDTTDEAASPPRFQLPTFTAPPEPERPPLAVAYDALATTVLDIARAHDHESAGEMFETAARAFAAARDLVDDADALCQFARTSPEHFSSRVDSSALLAAVETLREVGLAALRLGVEGFTDPE